MNSEDTAQLVVNLSDALWNCPVEATNGLNRATLCRAIIPLLAQGQPVSLAQVATAVSRPQDEVTAVLNRHMNIAYDEDGHIVGAGLTLRPTPHQIRVDGRTLYAWCALDALMYSPLLRRPVQVESPCAASGIPVRLVVTTQQVTDVEPPGAVVSIVLPQQGLDVRQGFCNHVHFFHARAAAASWLEYHADASILPMSDAYHLGQLMLARCC